MLWFGNHFFSFFVVKLCHSWFMLFVSPWDNTNDILLVVLYLLITIKKYLHIMNCNKFINYCMASSIMFSININFHYLSKIILYFLMVVPNAVIQRVCRKVNHMFSGHVIFPICSWPQLYSNHVFSWIFVFCVYCIFRLLYFQHWFSLMVFTQVFLYRR